MPTESRRIQMSKGFRMALLIAVSVSTVTGVMAWFQLERERRIDLEDQDRRAHMLAYQLKESVLQSIRQPDEEAAKIILAAHLGGHRRLIGFAVHGADGRRIAAGKDVLEFNEQIDPVVKQALAGASEPISTFKAHDASVHFLGTRLTDERGNLKGVLVAVHDISHLDDRAASRQTQFAFGILLVFLLLFTLVITINCAAYERPLNNLAEWMRRLRTENAPEAPPRGLPGALLAGETERLAASFRAARSTVATESRLAVHDHKVWTRERLRAQAVDCLAGGQLVVVSNREPYMHQLRDGKPAVIVPAGGLVTAWIPCSKPAADSGSRTAPATPIARPPTPRDD